jgi:hypothetical protein
MIISDGLLYASSFVLEAISSWQMWCIRFTWLTCLWISMVVEIFLGGRQGNKIWHRISQYDIQSKSVNLFLKTLCSYLEILCTHSDGVHPALQILATGELSSFTPVFISVLHTCWLRELTLFALFTSRHCHIWHT